MSDLEQAVLVAADRLVAAFARHDRAAYFSAFAPNATFIFHTLDRPLKSRAEYEAEWSLWEERDGFRVHACRSSERNVQRMGDIAVFTHRVETELEFNGEPTIADERETIVFERTSSGEWLAVHEHLSRQS
ncbi:nuclear transport factor 2 family protein [Ensifer adhaerens]|uniref:YybH family protein n=1 Tax=Ensifer adhaerens TaxID=106592 RepID=UPI001CBD73CA|nr:nuclear transport factor 2 family protein [Ensifer adhaerens]MBZ7922942.1 nuclear transport factor 2 family protein [Ensifer adhaerens]UAX91540.1 nuclear transport factor 2 family protein [Ensifer adhaerens]UAX99168.1 nuclear transport factor 2 family protein [Ensifer adhaerens]UAY06551.1 nuclear transport factor 2 family protein [Ensifer adhaerens]